MVSLETPLWALFFAVLLIACVYDILIRKVPNWLTVGLLCAGLGARFMASGLPATAWGAAGAAVGLGALLYPFARGHVAAGDVKLLAGMGAWLGPLATLEALLVGSVAGGLLSLIYLLRAPREQRKQILTNLRLTFYLRAIPDIEKRERHHSPPYAVALGAGALAAIIYNRVPFGLG